MADVEEICDMKCLYLLIVKPKWKSVLSSFLL